MKTKFRISLIAFLAISCCGFSQQKIGIFDGTTAIGARELKGAASYNSEKQTYTLSGAGTNMWLATMNFNICLQPYRATSYSARRLNLSVMVLIPIAKWAG